MTTESRVKKNFCFLLYNIDPGGLEVYLLRFFRHYQGQFRATLICKSGKTGALLKGYEDAGVEVITVRTGYMNPVSLWKIYRLLRNRKFDGICDLTSNFGGLYMWLARKASIRSRVAYYGQSTNHFRSSALKSLFDRMVNRLVYRNATAIVLNSHTATDNFFPYRVAGDPRFKVVYNGVDAAMFSDEKDDEMKQALGIPVSSFVIGHTGRFDEKKNHQAVLDLAVRACATWDDCYVICCGKGTEQLQESINRRQLDGRVLALGYRDDVHRILRTFDVFYFPSYTEGQPNSLIEAMMAGLPFVASDIVPIRDTVPEHLQGQLVGPDDVGSAFHLIQRMKEDRQLRIRLSCRDWAIEAYNANDRFREFLESVAGDQIV